MADVGDRESGSLLGKLEIGVGLLEPLGVGEWSVVVSPLQGVQEVLAFDNRVAGAVVSGDEGEQFVFRVRRRLLAHTFVDG